MAEKPTRRDWLSKLFGGLFGVGAAGAAAAAVPREAGQPVGLPAPLLPFAHAGDALSRVTTFVYDAAVPLSSASSLSWTSYVSDAPGRPLTSPEDPT